MKTIDFKLNDDDESITICPFKEKVPWDENLTCYVGACSCEVCMYNHGIKDNFVICDYPSDEIWSIDCAKDGDIVANENTIGIFRCIDDGKIMFHCFVNHNNLDVMWIAIEDDEEVIQCGFVWQNLHWRKASKAEKVALFSHIQSNHYLWDRNKKKMIRKEPEFLKRDKWYVCTDDYGLFWKNHCYQCTDYGKLGQDFYNEKEVCVPDEIAKKHFREWNIEDAVTGTILKYSKADGKTWLIKFNKIEQKFLCGYYTISELFAVILDTEECLCGNDFMDHVWSGRLSPANGTEVDIMYDILKKKDFVFNKETGTIDDISGRSTNTTNDDKSVLKSELNPDFVVTPIEQNNSFDINLKNLDDRQKNIIVNLIYSWNQNLE